MGLPSFSLGGQKTAAALWREPFNPPRQLLPRALPQMEDASASSGPSSQPKIREFERRDQEQVVDMFRRVNALPPPRGPLACECRGRSCSELKSRVCGRPLLFST